jgi:hypothetical protein
LFLCRKGIWLDKSHEILKNISMVRRFTILNSVTILIVHFIVHNPSDTTFWFGNIFVT